MSNFLKSRLMIIAIVFYLFLNASQSRAQSTLSPSGVNCGEPTETFENVAGWPQGATVTVNINTAGYSQQQIAALSAAINNWSGVGGVGLNVTLDDASITGVNTMQVQAGTPTDPTTSAETTTSVVSNETVVSASTVINSQITNTYALTITMAQELGHTFGLYDNTVDKTSVMADKCGTLNDQTGCGAVGPTQKDMAAVDCQNTYTENTCQDPGNSDSAACQCGTGTSGNCTGGLTCTANGACDCTDPCDDPYCFGWTDSCGTCRDDGDCQGGLVCLSNNTCGCSDPCDDPGCPGYTSSCSYGEGCQTDDDCAGDLTCISGTCGCTSSCDDPACPSYSAYVCSDGGDGGGGSPPQNPCGMNGSCPITGPDCDGGDCGEN